MDRGGVENVCQEDNSRKKMNVSMQMNASTSFGNVSGKADKQDGQGCYYTCYNSCLDQQECSKKEPEQAQQCKNVCFNESLAKCADVQSSNIDAMCPPPGYMPKYPGDYTEPKTQQTTPAETRLHMPNQVMAMYCNSGLMPAIHTILLMIIVLFLFIIMVCGVVCATRK